MTTSNRVTFAIILVLTSGVAIVSSMLLMRSPNFAIAAYSLMLGLTMIFVEPFIGLMNYLILLYLRPQEFIPGFEQLPIMLIVGGGTAALVALHMTIKKTTLGLRNVPQHWLVLWFFLAIAVSHMAHLEISGTADAVQWFLNVVILYFLVATLVYNEKRLRLTMVLLLIMTVFLAVQGIYQFFTGVGIAGQQLFQHRIVSIGIFSDPNDLALALLIILPFPMLLVLESPSLFVRVICFVAAAAIALTIFLSESRGGILSLGLLMALIFSKRYGWRMGVAAGVLMTVVIFALGPSRMENLSPEEASAFGRVQAWTVAFDLVRHFPLFGVGAREFTHYHNKTAHNSFLLCAAELGFFGLFPWMFLFLVSIKGLFFVNRNCDEGRLRSLALPADAVMLGLIGFFVGAMFLSRTYNPLLFILFGLAAAITGTFVAGSERHYKIVERRDIRDVIIITIALFIVLKAFLLWAW